MKKILTGLVVLSSLVFGSDKFECAGSKGADFMYLKILEEGGAEKLHTAIVTDDRKTYLEYVALKREQKNLIKHLVEKHSDELDAKTLSGLAEMSIFIDKSIQGGEAMIEILKK